MICKYCKCEIDIEADQNYRKGFPQGIHSRMSHGADMTGDPYHIFVWQCIRAYNNQGVTHVPV